MGKGDARSQLERFEVMVIERGQVKNAAYNPRTISADARRRLKAGIKKKGILQPIVWNKRTGNIVGGHQRVSIMDQLQGTQAYELTVAAVDLPEKEEVEANLLLNNAAAMGEFDLQKLEELIKLPELDIEATGWDRADIYRLFGSDKALAEMEPEKAQEVAESIKQTAEDYERSMAAAADRDSNDFYMVLVFKSYAERKAFCEDWGLEDNRYQSGQALAAAIAGDEDEATEEEATEEEDDE